MGLVSLRFYNFRNILNGELQFEAPEVFLVGENGQGKTNILEAVYCLCLGSSFRTRREERLITLGEEALALEGRFSREDGSTETVVYRYGRDGRLLQLDGKTITDRKLLLERFPCIVFCHEDIGFIKGPPDQQRLFFNQTLCLHDFLYLDSLRRYQRVLRERNAAAKGQREDLLEVYDLQLSQMGSVLQATRAQTIQAFNETFAALFKRVSGLTEPVVIEYLPSWPDSNPTTIAETLKRRRGRDLAFGTTTSGPHRDRYRFMQGERDFTQVASTGQIRLVSLVLKVAQAVFVHERTGKAPLLLLDDVLLELDPQRRQRFLENLPPAEQAFFTFLPDEQFLPYAGQATRMYTVSQGSVSSYGTGR